MRHSAPPLDTNAARAYDRLQQVNVRDAAAHQSLAVILRSRDAVHLHGDIARLRGVVTRSDDAMPIRAHGTSQDSSTFGLGERPDIHASRTDVTMDVAGARAVIRLLEMNPAFGRRGPPEVILDLSARDESEILRSWRAETAAVISLGVFAIGIAEGPPDIYMDVIARIAIGVDAISLLFRQSLLGLPIARTVGTRPLDASSNGHVLDVDTALTTTSGLPRPEPRFPPAPAQIPPELLRLGEEFLAQSCLLGVVHAAAAAGAARRASNVRTWSGGIAGLSRHDGCAGDELTIRGGPFRDTRPDRVGVIMSAYGGGLCFPEIISWANDEIVIRLPQGVGRGCVGFYEMPDPKTAKGAAGSATALAGEMVACFGKAAAGAAHQLQQNAGLLAILPPPCLTNGANQFNGGPPIVNHFGGKSGCADTTIGSTPTVTIRPGVPLTLSWHVLGATSIDIVAIQPNPTLDPANMLRDVIGKLQPDTGSVTIPGIAATESFDGSYELRATNTCTGSAPITRRVAVRVRRIVAVALSGGGAKGDFQVGVLKYLYDQKGLRPAIVTGTSVGSINAAKLAEGDDVATASNPRHAQARLEEIWRSLTRNEDMFLPEPWVQGIQNVDITRLAFGAILFPWRAAQNVMTAANLLYVSPVQSLATTIHGLQGAKFGVGDLSVFLSTLSTAQAVFNLSPIEALLADPALLDPGRVRDSGIALRLIAVSLQTGEMVQVTEAGSVLATGGGTATLLDGVIASASIPVAFPPRALGNHTCVDGGVREVLPLRAAVELGASEVYAIQTGAAPMADTLPPGVFPAGRLPMEYIGSRSILDWMIEEVTLNDFEPFSGWPPGVQVKLFRPTFNVNDMMQIEPGLINIAIDYGFMRASDVLDGLDDSRVSRTSLSDLITLQRMEAWTLEHSINRQALRPSRPGDDEPPPLVSPVPDRAGVLALREMKRTIYRRAKTWEQLGGVLPPSPERWWQEWETHWFPADYPNPWQEIYAYPSNAEATPPPA